MRVAKLGCAGIARTILLILPRANGEAGPRVCVVEGASELKLRDRLKMMKYVVENIFLNHRSRDESRAPPTILRSLCELRMVPPPHYRGAG